MRISELARRGGVSVATIKFYLREGLLPPGTRTGRNQADYSEDHLIRLGLIQNLTVLGRLSLASVREVLAAVDSRGLSPVGLCGVVNEALFADSRPSDEQGADDRTARGQVDEVIAALGWRVAPDAPARTVMAQVLVALRRLDQRFDIGAILPYARAADELAARDLGLAADGEPHESEPAVWVAGIVLREVVFAALRAMAREHRMVLSAEGEDHPGN